MQTIPIQAIPNQEFTVILDNNEWSFIVKYSGIMSVTLTLNGSLIMSSMRVVANEKIIPYEYLERESGNFMFSTANYELPDYTKFGVTQSLIYINAAEMAAIRTPPAYPIKATDFNPIAPLPLRFAPQGYILA